MKKLLLISLLITIFSGCTQNSPTLKINNIAMKIISPAFKHNEYIPSQYTCDGNNTNPLLEISNVPANTQSLVLISDDPDAPGGTWVHWLVWNIDPKITKIEANSVPTSSVQGITSFGKIGYGGPCPPSGTHRYYFKLYALDIKLTLDTKATKVDLEKNMQGHILDSAELIGLYQR